MPYHRKYSRFSRRLNRCKIGKTHYGKTSKCYPYSAISKWSTQSAANPRKRGHCGCSSGSGSKTSAGISKGTHPMKTGTTAAQASGVADVIQEQAKKKVRVNDEIKSKGKDVAEKVARESGKRTFDTMAKNPNPLIGVAGSIGASFF